jgi:hypothetical protein
VLSTTHGTLHHIIVELKRGRKVEVKVALARLGAKARRIVLRTDGHMPPPGRYTLAIFVRHAAVLHRTIIIRPRARNRG